MLNFVLRNELTKLSFITHFKLFSIMLNKVHILKTLDLVLDHDLYLDIECHPAIAVMCICIHPSTFVFHAVRPSNQNFKEKDIFTLYFLCVKNKYFCLFLIKNVYILPFHFQSHLLISPNYYSMLHLRNLEHKG